MPIMEGNFHPIDSITWNLDHIDWDQLPDYTSLPLGQPIAPLPNPPPPIPPLTPLELEVKVLIETKYIEKTRQYHSALMNRIREMDMRALLFESLENSYAGFEIDRNPRILGFTQPMKKEVVDLILSKCNEAGIQDLLCSIYYQHSTIAILVRLNRLLDPQQTGPFVIHDAGSPRNRARMDEDIRRLKDRVDGIETHISYMPGGGGYAEAQKSWESNTNSLTDLE